MNIQIVEHSKCFKLLVLEKIIINSTLSSWFVGYNKMDSCYHEYGSFFISESCSNESFEILSKNYNPNLSIYNERELIRHMGQSFTEINMKLLKK